MTLVPIFGPQGEILIVQAEVRYSEDQPRDPDGKFAGGGDVYTLAGAKELVGKLGDGVTIIGSVATKGESKHDLDLLAASKETAEAARVKLEGLGYEWMGNSTLSPKEAAAYKGTKTFEKGKWSVMDEYTHTGTGKHVEVWHTEAADEERSLRFDADQPRDPDGKFASGGGTSTSQKDIKMSPEEWEADHAQGLVDKVNAWVETSDFVGEEAAEAVRTGQPNVIVDAIRESEPVNQTCYRGMFCDKTTTGEKWDAMSWKAGQEVQIMPSSFSTNEKSASKFATGETMGLHGNKSMTQVMLKIEPGMKGLRVEDYATGAAAKVSSDEYEIISGGRYQVMSISKNQTGYPVVHPTSDIQVGKVYNSLRVITIRQIGVF